MTKTDKKNALEFSSFMTDVVGLMEKHKVNNLLLIFQMNGYLRNSYLHTEDEDPFYANLSDGINAWMKQGVNN